MKGANALPTAARATHTYIVGLPGVGKSKAIESFVLQDVLAGRGVGVIDPHGDLFRHLTHHLAACLGRYPEIARRLIIVDPCQPKWTVGLNPLLAVEGLSPERLSLFLTDVVVKIWRLDAVSAPRLVWLLTNSFLALSGLGLSLLDLPRFLLERDFREALLPRLPHEGVRSYFRFEFPKSDGAVHQWVTPVLNKMSGLLFDPEVRLMLAGRPTFNFRQVLDQQLVLLVNLPKGILGEGLSALLGAFIVAHLQKAALARADSQTRQPYYLYLDEFQNYTTDNIQDILTESRKYGLSLTLAHQYLDQLPSDLRSAVLNTTGTILCFRVGYHDAYRLAKEIFPGPDFLTRIEKEVKLRRLGRMPFPMVEEREEPLGWEGLALQIANLPQREFWVRRRGPYEPLQQRTLELPDPPATPALAEDLAALLDAAGQRYGRLKSDARGLLEGGRKGPEAGTIRSEPLVPSPVGQTPIPSDSVGERDDDDLFWEAKEG